MPRRWPDADKVTSDCLGRRGTPGVDRNIISRSARPSPSNSMLPAEPAAHGTMTSHTQPLSPPSRHACSQEGAVVLVVLEGIEQISNRRSQVSPGDTAAAAWNAQCPQPERLSCRVRCGRQLLWAEPQHGMRSASNPSGCRCSLPASAPGAGRNRMRLRLADDTTSSDA